MTAPVSPAAAGSPAAAPGPAWHTLTIDDALARQRVTAEAGLTSAEAAARLQASGPNKFAEGKREPRWRAFLRQYADPMQIVLLGAGIASLFIPNQFATGCVLILLTLLNAAMGLNQEGKASASVAPAVMRSRTWARRCAGSSTSLDTDSMWLAPPSPLERP